jgi:hypothetical protein
VSERIDVYLSPGPLLNTVVAHGSSRVQSFVNVTFLKHLALVG